MGQGSIPSHGKVNLLCPYCKIMVHGSFAFIFKDPFEPESDFDTFMCPNCEKSSIIRLSDQTNISLVYPDIPDIEEVNKDLDSEVQKDYSEAAQIYRKSPRGACALLRLLLQKVLIQIKAPGKDLNDQIGNLITEKQLDSQMQQALDVVRVIGNNAVHPGEIDLKDDVETAKKLFKIINLIARQLISIPKEVQALYTKVPTSVQQAIKNRNGKKKKP